MVRSTIEGDEEGETVESKDEGTESVDLLSPARCCT